MQIFDLTHTIREDMPVYPGTRPPQLSTAFSYEKYGFRETLLTMLTHTGTHIDAPAHLYADKKTLDALPAAQFIGKALVIDCRSVPENGSISMQELAPYGELIHQVDFLLFCTGWDLKWGSPDYYEGFPCVDEEVFDLILRGSYKGIGFDTISLDPVSDSALTYHNRLFAEKEIINIENLKDLHLLGDRPVMFACPPLKVENADGGPTRAIAWREEA